MPYCDSEEETNYVKGGTSFDRFINGHDPLVIEFRATESDIPIWNDNPGFASQAFTATQDGGVGMHTVYQSDDTFAGEYSGRGRLWTV